MNDYSNPSENIIFAPLEKDLNNYDGKSFAFETFATATSVSFAEDSVIGKHVVVPTKSYLNISFPEIAVGTSDFTLDFWSNNEADFCSVSTVTVSAELGMSILPIAEGGMNAAFLGSGYSGPYNRIPINYERNKWSHYALVRKDGIAYAFVDGVLQGSTGVTINLNSQTMVVNSTYANNPGRFCNSQNNYKNIRLCNFARWTEDFAPPIPGINQPDSFIITEKTQDENGNELEPDVTKTVADGDDFTTTAPAISGYKVIGYKVDNGTLISGGLVTLLSVDVNHTIIFIYKKDDGSGGDDGNKRCCCCTNIFHIYTCCNDGEEIKNLVNEIKCKCRCEC